MNIRSIKMRNMNKIKRCNNFSWAIQRLMIQIFNVNDKFNKKLLETFKEKTHEQF